MSARLQVSKTAFTAAFDHLIQRYCNVKTFDAVVQDHMKSNLQNYNQRVIYLVKQSTETYRWKAKRDISSLGLH